MVMMRGVSFRHNLETFPGQRREFGIAFAKLDELVDLHILIDVSLAGNGPENFQSFDPVRLAQANLLAERVGAKTAAGADGAMDRLRPFRPPCDELQPGPEAGPVGLAP